MRLLILAPSGRCRPVPIRLRALPKVCMFLAVLLLAAAPFPAPAGERDVLLRIDDRQLRAAGIELARVEPEAGTAQTVLPGTVIVPPQQLLVVAAPAAGLIESVLVGPNEAVRAGQPIARLRSTDLLEAQRTYLQALSAEQLAQQRLERDEQMFRERIIAERRLLTTRADYAYARTTMQEREQMLALLGMTDADIRELHDQRQMAASLTVTAPRDGVVLELRVSPGERVMASAPLFSV